MYLPKSLQSGKTSEAPWMTRRETSTPHPRTGINPIRVKDRRLPIPIFFSQSRSWVTNVRADPMSMFSPLTNDGARRPDRPVTCRVMLFDGLCWGVLGRRPIRNGPPDDVQRLKGCQIAHRPSRPHDDRVVEPVGFPRQM